MTSFTDKLIKDLDQNEKDAKRAEFSRLAVLKETIEDIEGAPVFFIYFAASILVFFFIFTTYGLVTTYSQVPQIEREIFQIFEQRGVSVKESNQNDHSLSGVLENVEVGFIEFAEMVQLDGLVYYSRKPSDRFFIVDEYWNVAYYYVNDRLHTAYGKRDADFLFSPITGVGLLVIVNIVYKRYKIKYKEMAGL